MLYSRQYVIVKRKMKETFKFLSLSIMLFIYSTATRKIITICRELMIALWKTRGPIIHKMEYYALEISICAMMSRQTLYKFLRED